MAGDRGAYRPIPVVLLDGKDFHKLTLIQRWVFVALKLSLGPAGIEVRYREALAHQLAAQTGAAAKDVSNSLNVLERDGWIQREDNLIWVVRQLEFENLNVNDYKHRKSIQNHIMGLPTLPIVGRVIERYPQWFPEGEFTPSEGLARVCSGSNQSEPCTDTDTDTDTDTKTETLRRPSEGKPSRNGATSFEEVWRSWPKKEQKIAAEQKFTQRIREGVPVSEIQDGIARYLKAKAAKDGGTIDVRYVHNLSTFLGPKLLWREEWPIVTPPGKPDGPADGPRNDSGRRWPQPQREPPPEVDDLIGDIGRRASNG